MISAFKNNTILIIIAIGFVIRLGWIYYIPNPQISDAICYKNSALGLAVNFTYNTCWGYRAFAPPGYPFFLSIFYFLGFQDIGIKIIQALLTSISIYLLYRICQNYFSEKISVASAAFLAIYLNQLAYCSVFATEPFFTFLFLSFICIAHFRQSWVNSILQVVVLIWLLFIKLQVLPLMIILFFMIQKNRSISLKGTLQFAVCVVAMVLWMGRNYKVVGKFVFATNSQVNLYIGNNSKANGRWMNYPRPDISEIRQMDFYYELLRNDHILMANLPKLLFIKIFHLWNRDEESIRYWIVDGIEDEKARNELNLWKLQQVCQLEYLFIGIGIICALCGIVIKKVRIHFLFFLPAIYFTGVAVVFFGDARFHYPAMPFLIPVAVTGWLQVLKLLGIYLQRLRSMASFF
jgi:hypothetical protein